MTKKTKIHIDEDKCVGCGQCVSVCQGGALEMVDGKAKLVREDYCDHLGNCIGECPVDAITFEEVEKAEEVSNAPAERPEVKFGGCPSMQNAVFDEGSKPQDNANVSGKSELNAWPIMLHLIRPQAPQFINADILIAATCTAFSFGKFHPLMLKDKALIVACPKLDQTEGYVEKLTSLFTDAEPRTITVVRMEVPCCNGLTMMVVKAREAAKAKLPIREVTIGLQGDMLGERYV